MARNKLMWITLVLSLGLLVTAAIRAFQIFSYLSAALILAAFATAAIERAERELDLAAYTGLIALFAILFGIGITGIWLLWYPGESNFTYVLGLPQSTLVFIVFLWLLPALLSIYYSAVIFPKIGDDETVEEIMTDARQAQRNEEFVLSTGQPETDSGVETDGGIEQ
jgi:xanthine/uracil permease